MFKMSLRLRIFLLIGCMAALSAGGTIALSLSTFRSQALFTVEAERDLEQYKTALDMERTLIRQREATASFAMSRDPALIQEIAACRASFQQALRNSLETTRQERFAKRLRAIAGAYEAALEPQQTGGLQTDPLGAARSAALLERQPSLLTEILAQCRAYKVALWAGIRARWERNRVAVTRLGYLELGTVFSYLALTGILILILLRQVLRPVRRMALETGSDRQATSLNEVQSLDTSLHSFIEDFDYTHRELAKSREHLEQAEKMAMVGKLAASVAHSIRNPFTSIKMRLFSLSRNLDMNEAQTEDLEVISEEITRIDTIVQNFLQFARPPKIRMRIVHCTEVVDSVLQILKHRLQACGIEVRHTAAPGMPATSIDPDQLQEALLNILINACEAMEAGGTIAITESVRENGGRRMLALEVCDNGPGVSEAIKDRIVQPFFTTKEEGTGLGLSIAARIAEGHRGWLEVSSTPGEGACFSILLPVSREEGHELHSDHR